MADSKGRPCCSCTAPARSPGSNESPDDVPIGRQELGRVRFEGRGAHEPRLVPQRRCKPRRHFTQPPSDVDGLRVLDLARRISRHRFDLASLSPAESLARRPERSISAGRPSRWSSSPLGLALREAQAAPESIPDIMMRVAKPLGATDIAVYLVDFAQKILQPMPDRAPPTAQSRYPRKSSARWPDARSSPAPW